MEVDGVGAACSASVPPSVPEAPPLSSPELEMSADDEMEDPDFMSLSQESVQSTSTLFSNVEDLVENFNDSFKGISMRFSDRRKCLETRGLLKMLLRDIDDIIGDGDDESVECTSASADCVDCLDLLDVLEDGVNKTNLSRDRLKLISLSPKTWPAKNLAGRFGVSLRSIYYAKKIRNSGGSFSESKLTSRNKLPESTIASAHSFFTQTGISRPDPCASKCIWVTHPITLEKRQEARHLLLLTVPQAYALFLQENPSVGKISLSKFTSLRPKNVYLAKDAGTWNSCLCESHQNFKLLVDAIDTRLDYKYFNEKFVCSITQKECAFSKLCEKCNNSTDLTSDLVARLQQKYDDDAPRFQKWGKNHLSWHEKSQSDFIEYFLDEFRKFLRHQFTAKNQQLAFEKEKEKLQPGELIILTDFAENYKFTVQDAVQGFHWSNDQVSLVPHCIYYMDASGDVREQSFMVVSECLDHDTVGYHSARALIIRHLKETFPNLRKVTYFSDGACQHFKSFKAMSILSRHFELYDLEASWIFFGTGHGKSSCDAISAVCKRLATDQSKRAVQGDQILTPRQFFDFLVNKTDRVRCFFLTKEEVAADRLALEPTWAKYKQISGIRSYHHFQAVCDGRLLAYKHWGDLNYETIQFGLSST